MGGGGDGNAGCNSYRDNNQLKAETAAVVMAKVTGTAGGSDNDGDCFGGGGGNGNGDNGQQQ